MSTEAHKQLVSGLVDEVWNQHDAAAIDRYLGPGLREEVAEHYQQLLHGFPDLQVTVEDDLIAEGDRVVARLTLMAPTPDRSRAKAAAGSLSAGRRSESTGSPAAGLSRRGRCRTALACCNSSALFGNWSPSTGRAATSQAVPDEPAGSPTGASTECMRCSLSATSRLRWSMKRGGDVLGIE
jgi:hypothetical protein